MRTVKRYKINTEGFKKSLWRNTRLSLVRMQQGMLGDTGDARDTLVWRPGSDWLIEGAAPGRLRSLWGRSPIRR